MASFHSWKDRAHSRLQDATQRELNDESERNKDDIAECEDLEQHYNERVDIYEVSISH